VYAIVPPDVSAVIVVGQQQQNATTVRVRFVSNNQRGPVYIYINKQDDI